MSAPLRPDTDNLWEREGFRAGSALDQASSAIVVGDDPERAAWVALGLGRAQAARRRVAIADLVGEAKPLQALVSDEQEHGIAESFNYGVSLNKIAQPVEGFENLFILPSGVEPVADPEIYRNERWRRLAAGFREVGALLIIVARADTEGVEELAMMFDGMVLAGEADESIAASAPVLAAVSGPRETRSREEPPTLDPRKAPRLQAPRPRPWLVPALAGTVLVSGVMLVAQARRNRDAPPPEPELPPAAVVDTTTRVDSAPRADSLPLLVVRNPADSLSAAAYGVEVFTGTSQNDASLEVRALAAQFPAVTFSPVFLGGSGPFYRVLVGAFADRAQAEGMLAPVKKARPPDAGSPAVTVVPLALLVRDSVPAGEVPALVADFDRQGIPVYALLQASGAARLYAGAFETPEQAGLLAQTLRQAGIEPVLVYRTGRVQ